MTEENDKSATQKIMEVELGSFRIPLPEDQAKSLINWRDEQKAKQRENAEKLGQFEQAAKAAAEAEKKARDEAEMSSLKAKGEVDEIVRRIREQEGSRVSALAAKYRDRALESLIARADGVLPEALADISRALSSSCNYDIESDSLIVLDAAGKPRVGADGKPIAAEVVIREFLDARPYFRKSVGSPGSGAQGGGKNLPAPAAKITQADLEKLTPIQAANFFKDGGSVIN